MSPLRSTLLALAAIGILGISNFGANVLGNVISHALVPPAVYVLPEVEVEVPVVDHTVCVEVLAQDVGAASADCMSCHPSQTLVISQDDWIEIPAPNSADEDTGGGIRRDRWIPGEAIGL